jgi:hypothetical protein
MKRFGRVRYLHRHRHVGGSMDYSLNSTICTVTELFPELELIHVDGEGWAIGKVNA